ncbi:MULTISPECIES: diaminopimelate epimerase [Clostridia]|uniref:diaminopimelate epimerase n=1 Tax=Clostridia TaxID=186801 RepID=UPI000EA04EED|nr:MULTISPECIES: diaminopimelate epimerase [Clostridia]NBJ69257.1 diaminopimelate epimerase [Roseburia sp. 1XD42-34]RKI79226.1 diaminopimelate epimerase [Clostridium sp. 1xD42-85]
MQIPFIKMHGLGNNYIYLDFFQYTVDEEKLSALAKSVSDVHTGIGSDGLIIIHPSEIADVGMRIFNKDGSEGQSCGNGLRCTAKYAFEQGIVAEKRFRIETKANIVEAEVQVTNEKVDQVTINMGKPHLERELIPMQGTPKQHVISEPFDIQGQTLEVTAISMGNPHAVFLVDQIDEEQVSQLGPLVEKDNRFPQGANVEFIEIISPVEINFSVWERGSGITQACGTGACAAVVAGVLNGQLERNESVTVHLPGGDLDITWDANGNVWMTGGAETIATGVFYSDM